MRWWRSMHAAFIKWKTSLKMTWCYCSRRMFQKLSNSFLTLLLSLKSEVLTQSRHPKLTKTYKCFTSDLRTLSKKSYRKLGSDQWSRPVVRGQFSVILVQNRCVFCNNSAPEAQSLEAAEGTNEVDVALTVRTQIALLEVQVVCICRIDLGGTPVTVDDDSAIH